ncbi:hypothetical protein GLYMA_07G219700v4 [Glycine max]|uniref:Bet v I/Major latex protein domain-containing protein n=1 Tax=Glycine max TaxID=3847 RepID=K7L354_SOYBN|nr:hypothetical protein GYH30_019200 [Glycine max]KRH50391.1 hypothetical protein GLYMA_07G219700v4 [Glycine max]
MAESDMLVKASADHFYDSLKGKKQHRVHDVAPDHIHKVEVHQGEWAEKSGNIKELTFATLKERVEFDDENKKITYTILEGDMLNLVKWTFLYEKVDHTASEPTKYKDLVVKLVKNVEALLVEAATE